MLPPFCSLRTRRNFFPSLERQGLFIGCTSYADLFTAWVADRPDGGNNPLHKERGRKDRYTKGEVDITKSCLRPRAGADHLNMAQFHLDGLFGGKVGIVHLVIEIEGMRLYKNHLSAVVYSKFSRAALAFSSASWWRSFGTVRKIP